MAGLIFGGSSNIVRFAPFLHYVALYQARKGGVVMFTGSVDLGPKDGGVYDWIGRATDEEFVGFYTSAAYTGVFSLSRVK